MNHIYKVIWNKAKHCYTVVSEIAKSHSDSTKRVRMGTTAALMAVAVLTGFAMPAQAAVSIGTDGTVKAEAADINALNDLLKNGVTNNKDGSVTVGGLTVKKNGEVSSKSQHIVYGKGAQIKSDITQSQAMGFISIGNNATAWIGGGGQERSFAYDGKAEHAAGAIAIGSNTFARTGSIMIGSHEYKGNMGDVKDIDTDVFNTGENGAYGHTVNSTTIGTNSFTKGSLATTIGDYNIQSGKSMGYNDWVHGNLSSLIYGAQNFGATVLGALNSNESQSATISGYGTSGVANSIVGVANRVNSSNGTLVFGAGNEVTNSLSYVSGASDSTALRDAKNAQDTFKDAVAKSDGGGAVLAIGGANKADWAQKSQLVGVGNTLTGTSNAVSMYDMINGYKNEVTNATHTSIIGSNNKAKDTKSTTVTGDNNDVTGSGNHIIGDNHKVTGANNIIVGNNKEQKTHTGHDSVIIGNNASAGTDSLVMGNKAHAGNTGIALGMNASAGDGQNLAIGYYANVSGAKNSTALGYASKVEKRDILSSDGNDGVVSVGKSVGQSGEAGITRRIINVKAGVNDTDAVNVSQLKGVETIANKGWNLTTGGVPDATQVKPGDTVDFSGDTNISVSHKGTDVSIALKDTLMLGSNATDGYVTVDGVKGTVWAGHAVSAGNVNMDGDSGEITGLTNTTLNSKDFATTGRAATEEQLKLVKNQADSAATEASKHSKVVNGSNITVEETDQDGQKTYKVGLNKNLEGIESISNGDAKINLNDTGVVISKGKDKTFSITDTGMGMSVIGDDYVTRSIMVGKTGTVISGGLSVAGSKITNVAAGSEDTDAVNVSQLKGVESIANMGWNLATNGVAAEATNVKPGEYVDFSGDKNISVSHDGTKVKVELNKDIDVNSVQTNALNSKYNLSVGTANENGIMPFFVNSTGDFYAAHNKFHVDKDGKVTATAGEIGNVVLQNGVYYGHSTLQDGSLLLTDDNGNHSYIDAKGAKLGKVTVAEDGKITGVAAGAITADSTDAVNGSQLHAVATEAGKHSKVVNGSNINVEETDVDGQKIYKVGLNDDILLGKLTGNNVSISGTNGTIETTGYIATKDRIIADKGAQLADITVSGNAISNGEAKVALDGAAGTAGMINGKGASLYMQDGTTVINNKVGIDQEGKITGVAAGKISADSTDAVNGSQLFAVQQEAGKHTKVVNGSNITVEETDQDGQKTYKVGLNKDLLLGDITGKNVSISGTNGTIETTGSIATKDKIYADKGAKLADVNVTGDTISNDKSSVKLDKDGTVTINNKVTVDQNGKVSGVAAGDISDTSTDAVNGSQLKATNDRVSKVEGDITNIRSDITDIKGDVKDLGVRVTKVEQEAGKHTKVVNGSNVTVEETDQDGQKTYKVGLNKDLLLGDITGKNVSISGTNGTIETTGSIATKDKIYADKGAKLADVNVTGDTISNDKSSVKLDKNGTVTINNKVTVDQDGKVSGVAIGDISEKSTDAVNGSQLFETKKLVAQNAQSISKLGNRINKVGAGAAALAALHPLDFDPDDKWDIAAGYGNYNGENAAAIGAYYRPNEDTMFSVGGSFGNGENMVNAGVSLKLGQGNHVSTSKVAMAKEIKDLRKELEGLKSALLDVNAGKKLDTSKLQLFPDVPKNHWAYEYVSTLKGNGALTGYPDGEFKGDRPMTRYEFATMLYKAMLEGATLSDRILKEFAPELERFTVDTVHQDKDGKPTVERVRTVKAEK